MKRCRRIRIHRLCACLALAACALTGAPVAADADTVSAWVELHPETVYAGERFALYIAIRSRGVQVGHDFQLSGLPEQDRFERLGSFAEMPIERTQQDGLVTETRRYRVRARAPDPGTITVAPILELALVRRRAMGWGSVREMTRQRVAVDPAELTVRPLPPVPEDLHFSGAVGRFTLTVEAAPLELAPGDLLTVRSRIAGDGALDPVDPPRIDAAPGFQRYAPRRIATEHGALFEQTLIPRTTNATALFFVTFTFFDPHAGTYRTVRSGPERLTFRPETVTQIDLFQPDADDAVDTTVEQREAGIVRMRAARRGTHLALPVRRAAHVAPGSAALLLFELPAGTPVRALARQADWLRIEAGRKRGWIQIP